MKDVFVITFTNITELENLYNDNINQQKQILESARMASMGEMIGNIAHQWRQPLSSISTIATGTRLRYKNNLISDDELDETFLKIKDHTQHLSKTIDEFRDFLKFDKTKDLFFIQDTINQSILLTEALYKDNNIELEFIKTENKISLNGSSGELVQVFLNILNNAKDALSQIDKENKTIFITLSKEKEKTRIIVRDNAEGIEEAHLDKIFDPYFTTNHKSKGKGLGLYIAKMIIEEGFNGSISAHNHNGACFSIIIS